MLEEKIQDDVKSALKNSEKIKVSALRMLISDIKNRKIAERIDALDDENVISIIQKRVRQHNESIEQFKKASREDLVSQELAELAVLKAYLPEEISKEAVKQIVEEVVKTVGASSLKDMGTVMKESLSRLKGRSDGKVVSDIVKEILS